jgi:hypothetical protein
MRRDAQLLGAELIYVCARHVFMFAAVSGLSTHPAVTLQPILWVGLLRSLPYAHRKFQFHLVKTHDVYIQA